MPTPQVLRDLMARLLREKLTAVTEKLPAMGDARKKYPVTLTEPEVNALYFALSMAREGLESGIRFGVGTFTRLLEHYGPSLAAAEETLAKLDDDNAPYRPGAKCQFYGTHAVPELRLLVTQGGNQCALVTESYSPCYMEIAGKEPDLEKCGLQETTRAGIFAAFSRHSQGGER